MKYFACLIAGNIKNLAFYVLLFCTVQDFAQGETRNWYFGQGAGLDFSTNPPTTLTNGVVYTAEGVSVMSTPTGSLLFYTNGVNVYNRSHVLMANGAGLMGNNSTTQSALIVPLPGTPGIFYIFTLDDQGGPDGFRYSVVTMSLSAGMGSVTAKNVPVYTPSTEKLTAVRSCNGIDIWLVTHEFGTNFFRSYLLTPAGLNMTPVISAAGSVHNGLNQNLGQMKISPNGRKLGLVTYSPGSFELFDFDPATGQVTNPIVLAGSPAAYGCEFSPDGTLFYAGVYNYPAGEIYQWDLCAGSPMAIIASQYTLVTGITAPIGSLQLGPDEKIYIAQASTSQLSVINNPNLQGSACNFSLNAISLSPRNSSLGLPNFVCSLFRQVPPLFTYTLGATNGCQTASFSAPPVAQTFTTVGCVASGYSVSGLTWTFGDPASGSSNTSTLVNPVHAFTGTGNFTTQLVINYSCGNAADTLRQLLNIGPPLLGPPGPITGPAIVCQGSTSSYSVSALNGALSYSWTTPISWPAPGASNTVVLSPAGSGTISVSAIYACGTSAPQIFSITVSALPSVTVTSSNPSLCVGASALLNASGAQSYTWNTGSSGASVSVSPITTTSYSVNGTSSAGCTGTSVFVQNVNPAPAISAASNVSLMCQGQSAVLTATGGAVYVWNPGALPGNSISVSPLSTTVYTVTGTSSAGCTNDALVTQNVISCSGINELVTASGRLNIFPNPSHSSVSVFTHGAGDQCAELINALGEVIFVALIKDGHAQIGLESFAPGVYFVKVGTNTKKIIKQ